MRNFLHGDGFAAVGTRDQVKWFRGALENRFEIKSQCIGRGALGFPGSVVSAFGLGPAATPAQGEKMVEDTEGRLLNRVFRCT